MRRYKRVAAARVDEHFGKPRSLYAIARPPFYAVKLNVLRHTPRGGLALEPELHGRNTATCDWLR